MQVVYVQRSLNVKYLVEIHVRNKYAYEATTETPLESQAG